MIRALKAGLLYFAVVFAAGFMLGIVRVLWLEPLLGVMWAELAEMPVMLAVILFSAHRIVGRFRLPARTAPRLIMGGLALALLLLVELTVVLQLRGLSLVAYLDSRDPIAGSTYGISLLIYALTPLFIGRASRQQS
jgi:hypothetical protein